MLLSPLYWSSPGVRLLVCWCAVKDVALAYLLQATAVTVSVEQKSISATISGVAADTVDFGTVTSGLTNAQVVAYPSLNMYPS